MAYPLLLLILNAFGVFIEASVTPESRYVDSVQGYKLFSQADDALRRNRRLIIPRPDGMQHSYNTAYEVSTPNSAPEHSRKRGLPDSDDAQRLRKYLKK